MGVTPTVEANIRHDTISTGNFPPCLPSTREDAKSSEQQQYSPNGEPIPLKKLYVHIKWSDFVQYREEKGMERSEVEAIREGEISDGKKTRERYTSFYSQHQL